MSLSDTVKSKTKHKIISWHCAHSKELLTFSAFGIICLTFWHFTTTQVKHTIKCLDQGPGEKPPWCTSCTYKTTEMVVDGSLWLCFLSNVDAGKPNTWHCRQLLGTVAATVQERCNLSSTDWHSGSTALWAPWALHLPCSVCLQRAKLCGMCWSSVLTLSNRCNEGCPHRTELPHQETYKLKIAYRSLFIALRLKPRPGDPYIWA